MSWSGCLRQDAKQISCLSLFTVDSVDLLLVAIGDFFLHSLFANIGPFHRHQYFSVFYIEPAAASLFSQTPSNTLHHLKNGFLLVLDKCHVIQFISTSLWHTRLRYWDHLCILHSRLLCGAFCLSVCLSIILLKIHISESIIMWEKRIRIFALAGRAHCQRQVAFFPPFSSRGYKIGPAYLRRNHLTYKPKTGFVPQWHKTRYMFAQICLTLLVQSNQAINETLLGKKCWQTLWGIVLWQFTAVLLIRREI